MVKDLIYLLYGGQARGKYLKMFGNTIY